MLNKYNVFYIINEFFLQEKNKSVIPINYIHCTKFPIEINIVSDLIEIWFTLCETIGLVTIII